MNKAQEAIFVALKNAHCDVRVAEEKIWMHETASIKWFKNRNEAMTTVPQLKAACRTLGLTEAEIEQAGEWVKE